MTNALSAYGINVSRASDVAIRAVSESSGRYLLERTARGSVSEHDVPVPRRCTDRAAALAVVIDALVAPYFWPSGRANSKTKKSALDFLPPLPATAPASAPTSEPTQLADVPASKPSSTPASAEAPASLPAAHVEAEPPEPAVPMSAMIEAGIDLLPARGRFGVAYSLEFPRRLRWFAQVSFLTPINIGYGKGVVSYSEGAVSVGLDVRLWRGLFAGALVGVQIVRVVATGYDQNQPAWLANLSLQLRVGYRHPVTKWLELGLAVTGRLDVFRQNLLVDDVTVATLEHLHVGAQTTAAILW